MNDTPVSNVCDEEVPVLNVKNETPKVEPPVEEVKKEVIEPVNEKEFKILMSNLPNVQFKFNNFYFKVTYVNIGTKRFTAELVNSIISEK